MYECDICLSKIKKQFKNKHEKSIKHQYFFSNMAVNKYIVKRDEIDKFKVILQSYCDDQRDKFNDFTIKINWKKNNMIINKLSLPISNTWYRRHFFKPEMFELSLYEKMTKSKFKDIINKNCIYNEISDEIEIIFVSNYKDITLQKYITLPRSMLFRKFEQYYMIDCYNEDWNMDFLPNCFRYIRGYPANRFIKVESD